MQKQDQNIFFSATDLTYFAQCRHRTWLDRIHLDSPMEKAEETDSMALVMEKGLEHESNHLQSLKNRGLKVVEIEAETQADKVRLTREALEAGADVVFQATLQRGAWLGHADFLIRTERQTEQGRWVYEVADTKLAHHTHTKFLVQLCFYSDLLADITGCLPEYIHVELGNGKRDSYRLNDYFAYYKRLIRQFEESMQVHSGTPPVYPEPCKLCSACCWRNQCDEQRLADDHLSQVANITKTQIVKLAAAGIPTMKALAGLSAPGAVKGIQAGALVRLAEQARLQVHEKETGEQVFTLLTPEDDGKGFNRLPPPDEGDLFFDMEGDPMYPEGLEYLFGVYYKDAGKAQFKAFWAHNRDEEGQAFSDFMDFVNQRLAQYPGAHIYHYASYEKTALKRLMSLHGRHEESVDRLLREQKLVDLYRVLREGIRISKPSYSIKKVEQFYSTARTVQVTNAAESIVVYERWRQQSDPALLKNIEDYNQDDCRSTWELREWLIQLRPASASWFSRFTAATEKPKTAKQLERQAEQAAKQAAHEAWLKALELRIQQSQHLQSRPESYRQLLLQIVDFHKRAAKPAWWALFDRAEAETEELLDDMEVIADMQFIGQLENGRIPKVSKWKFPEQEFKCKAGDPVVLLNVEGMIPGSIESIDEEKCELLLKSTQLTQVNLPVGMKLHVSAGLPISTEIIAEAVKAFVESEIQGMQTKSAVRQFLLREPPRFANRDLGETLLKPEAECGVDRMQQIKDLIANMQHSCLFIQGPPGTGKTYTGSHVIAHLIRMGKKVAIASNSHKAINNLVEKTAAVLQQLGHRFEGIKIGRKDEHAVEGYCLNTCLKQDLLDEEPLSRSEVPDLLAGTAWLFSDDRLKGCFDYLFIDEAGQVATANTVGMGQCADNIVLLGDQMQLGQPIQGDHPGESGLSTLEYLLGHKATIEPHRGIFLDQSFRMHPDVCSYISDTFYEGRLQAADTTHQQGLVLHGRPAGLFSATGVYCLPVNHDGNSQRSHEEAQEIARLYSELLEQQFINQTGEVCQMSHEEILVVAPYNVQVNLLKRILPEGARVGTVDKFQGQEAQVVLVSMTTSNEQHMPRQLDFLFSRNRLNVAISRAKSIAVVVMSPALADVSSDRPETLGLINTFIGLVSQYSVEK